MKARARVTATATVERWIEVEVSDKPTEEEIGRKVAKFLAGPDGSGNNEDLINRSGEWEILGVLGDSLLIQASESTLLHLPPGVSPSDVLKAPVFGDLSQELEQIKGNIIPE